MGVENMEFLSKFIGLIGGIVGIIGGILGIMSLISGRKREKQIRQEEDDMWNLHVVLVDHLKGGSGKVWNPKIGSDEHKLAEKMVEKGLLERAPATGLGGYSLLRKR
jgi:hypothetical protein